MGIINLTPDSFWEASRYSCARKAYDKIRQMKSEGALMVDIGAVSSRPGADTVSADLEWQRLEPLLQLLGQHRDEIPEISIDTTRSTIVRKAFDTLGSFIVNDISAGEDDPQMLPTVAELGLKFIAMHHRGDPKTMDTLTDYPFGVTEAVKKFFEDFGHRAQAAGLQNWILDPGFGFAKTDAQNMELLQHIGELTVFGRPVLVGVSNKRFTRGREQEVNTLLAKRNYAILRVHDVAAARKLFEI